VQVIYGINPVIEVLKGNDWPIIKLVLAKGRGGEPVQRILNLANEKRIPVDFKDREYLDRETGCKAHQGVVGFCREFAYASVDDVIANRHRDLKNNVILILDSITDPQNLGSLIRTTHCFGVNGVIITRDRSASITASVMKSSSGAARHTLVAMEVNLSNTIEYLKTKDFWIYGADAAGGQNIHTIDYTGNIAVVMGSERKGIRPLIKKKCDFLLSIPMKGKIDSLNVSVAAGIIFNEILRTWDES
jgi:23S rRNA (guanosine2251-2'-O)-methyltransferase